jgi:hypothetical protein
VIECVPTASELVVRVAEPLLIGPVPSIVAPSWNVTIPVAPDVIVAVKITLVPNVDGFSEETRATVLDALVTSWDTGVEVELL